MCNLLVYYRIYVKDGAVSSKAPVAPGDPFLGRIKCTSVPPPRTVKAVKSSIAKVENINDLESTSLFRSPFSQSPMNEDCVVAAQGSTPEKPLAFVTMLSDAGERGRPANAAESDTADFRYGGSIQYCSFRTINIFLGNIRKNQIC